MLNLADFEQRGPSGYYYRRDRPRGSPGTPYVLSNCAGCGRPCLLHRSRRGGRLCSPACPSRRSEVVAYRSAHTRLSRSRGPAASCVFGCQAARYQWANLTGNLLDLDDYAAMCIRCHRRYDAAVRVTETRPARWTWEPWRRAAV